MSCAYKKITLYCVVDACISVAAVRPCPVNILPFSPTHFALSLSRSVVYFLPDKYVDPDDGQPRPGDDYRTIDLPTVMDLPKVCTRAREAIKTEEFCNISLCERLETRLILTIVITVFVRMRMIFVVFKLTPFGFNISRDDGTVIKKNEN